MKNPLRPLLCLALAACASAPPPFEPGPARPTSTASAQRPLAPPARTYPAAAPVRAAPRTLAAPSAPHTPDFAARALPRFTVDRETSLRKVMEYIEAVAGVDVYVWDDAEEAVLDAGVEFDIKIQRRISLTKALDLVCELAGDEVSWRYKDGLIQVGSRRQLRGPSKTYIYDVSDLVRSLQNFPGREFNVAPSGGLIDLDEDVEERAPIINSDTLEDLIRSTILPETWDEEDVDIRITGGKLVIRHYR